MHVRASVCQCEICLCCTVFQRGLLFFDQHSLEEPCKDTGRWRVLAGLQRCMLSARAHCGILIQGGFLGLTQLSQGAGTLVDPKHTTKALRYTEVCNHCCSLQM